MTIEEIYAELAQLEASMSDRKTSWFRVSQNMRRQRELRRLLRKLEKAVDKEVEGDK